MGVIYYILIAIRGLLKKRQNATKNENNISLNIFLDLVALGTIADVVPLDKNNRILVVNGLSRIRMGKSTFGISALFKILNISHAYATTSDLAYFIAPQINASGRLNDISIGIECLLSDNFHHAFLLASQLKEINESRKKIELRITNHALSKIANLSSRKKTITCFNKNWHLGVTGIVASRLKDKFNRPTFVFTQDPNQKNMIKGSGRSLTGIHLKNILDTINQFHPQLITAYGGHAMAAGITLNICNLSLFEQIFEKQIQKNSENQEYHTPPIQSDGKIAENDITLELLDLIEQQAWGQHFPQPTFSQTFRVINQRIIQNKHLQLLVQINKKCFNAIWFNHSTFTRTEAIFAFYLKRNYFGSQNNIQLVIVDIEE